MENQNNFARQIFIPQRENDLFRYDLKEIGIVELTTRRLNQAQDALIMRLSDLNVSKNDFENRLKIYNDNVEYYNKIIKEYEADNTATETLENGIVISVSSRLIDVVKKVESARRALSESQYELAKTNDAIDAIKRVIVAYKAIIENGIDVISTDIPQMPEVIKYPQEISDRAFGIVAENK